ncbi:MAG: RNB domain-containing ribonuclease [Candidatus Methylomirabilis oxygeniifera]|uniref:Putative exoribonuclease II n=1 Tax=Methylomirabilis oxygeniifera TaxID=671143 RepID=D5MM25_METO1|nr:MAG: RNB domain-containing ribonuclease [Candidatus Methylomirabilis oxyfera]CBE67911.1 putative exoribonuclease II [Candidatus Methylomirabilis oxyfera]
MNYTGQGHRYGLQAIARRAMLARGLLPDFSPAVVREISGLTRPAAKPTPSIRDLRRLCWCSIDNDDSRDLDQLTVAEPLGGGAVKILVAVADVDALVRKGSAVDAHAQHNTTSVYTEAEIFPMLPLPLSTDLTSLNEDEDRLAVVIEMVVNQDGSLGSSDIYRALVVNHAKLTYHSVAAWLDGREPAPGRVATVTGLDEQLRVQDRVAQTLRTVRHMHGALSLETIEPRAVFEDDVLTDLRAEDKNRAQELIEDLMIAANRVTVRYLEARGLPSLRRILRSPDRWQRIVDLAAHMGERLPPEPDAVALETFLSIRRRMDPVRFPDLSLTVVKLIGRGEYVVEGPDRTTPGHFGLAIPAYTHSTAPNRRFPDLLTQRLLKAALAEHRVPYSFEELGALAQHCTEQEDHASKVERRVRKSAAALLLESKIGQHFDAIVTGASRKGTWVRIIHPSAEGKVIQGFEGLDVGDRVRVKLLDTNVEQGFIDFARV